MLKLIKYFLLSSFLVFISYYSLLVSNQKTRLYITMINEQNNTMMTQLFCTSEGVSYSEPNSIRTSKNIHQVYRYTIPSVNNIANIRFDPCSSAKEKVYIDNLQIVEHTWRSTKTYFIPLDYVEPLNAIENFKIEKNRIHFTSGTTDPQLKINLPDTPSTIIYTFHLYIFLLSILIVIVIFYLYSLYKTEKIDEIFKAKLILYTLFLFFTFFKVSYYDIHVNKFYPPDELAHLSYIDHISHHPGFIPKFETMRTLNNKEAGLYLSHPPFYYQLMLLSYDKKFSIMSDTNIQNFRKMNNIIFLLTFMLILYLSFNTKISILGHFTYLSVVTSIPMYAYSGASISNDNLAILGGLIFILGLKQMMQRNYSNLTYFILGLGIFISYFSKLTVAILIFFAFIFYFIYLFKDKKMFHMTKIQIGIILFFLIPIIYYQIHILLTYHSIMPTFNVTYPEQYLKSVFYTPENSRLHYTSLQWLARMEEYVIGGWFGIHSHHSFVKESFYGYLGLLLLHIFALISLFSKCPTGEVKLYCRLGKITLLSLIMVLVIQYIFSYKTHLSSGYMGGLQPRYLLPFMFSFAIMASLFVERFKQYFVFTIIITLICIHALYSDFFYFLQYY